VRAWIGDRDLTVVAWRVSGGEVELELLGADVPGDTKPLADALADALARPVTVTVLYTPQTVSEASSGG
jgi:hypothetical protein